MAPGGCAPRRTISRRPDLARVDAEIEPPPQDPVEQGVQSRFRVDDHIPAIMADNNRVLSLAQIAMNDADFEHPGSVHERKS